MTIEPIGRRLVSYPTVFSFVQTDQDGKARGADKRGPNNGLKEENPEPEYICKPARKEGDDCRPNPNYKGPRNDKKPGRREN